MLPEEPKPWGKASILEAFDFGNGATGAGFALHVFYLLVQLQVWLLFRVRAVRLFLLRGFICRSLLLLRVLRNRFVPFWLVVPHNQFRSIFGDLKSAQVMVVVLVLLFQALVVLFAGDVVVLKFMQDVFVFHCFKKLLIDNSTLFDVFLSLFFSNAL